MKEIRGEKLETFSVHAILIVTLPGNSKSERVPVSEVLLTEDGRLVFVSTPFKNLALKKEDE